MLTQGWGVLNKGNGEKESFRNEREDLRRGQRAIKEPLGEREAEWMQRVKSDNDLWHRVHNPDNGREEWDLIDPYSKRWYDPLIEKIARAQGQR
jgi:hypothetical protein